MSQHEGLRPSRTGHGCLEKEGAKHIVRRANRPLGFAVLLGSIWAGHVECSTIKKKELTSGGIIKFSTVVTLDALNGGVELRANIPTEVRESRESLGLRMKRKSPKKMRAVVQNDKIIFVIRDTGHGWRP